MFRDFLWKSDPLKQLIPLYLNMSVRGGGGGGSQWTKLLEMENN